MSDLGVLCAQSIGKDMKYSQKMKNGFCRLCWMMRQRVKLTSIWVKELLKGYYFAPSGLLGALSYDVTIIMSGLQPYFDD
jgi:hypothetical protein